MIDPILMSGLISARICHDMVSPVSSITNAIDLVDDPASQEMHEQAQTLLRSGAEDASLRIQFLRAVFGSIGSTSQAAPIHDAKKFAEGYVKSHKPSLDWDIETNTFTYAHQRLLMNVVLIGVECLPRGGVLNVKVREEAGGLTIRAMAKGNRATFRNDVDQILAGNTPEEGWTSRNIQPLFAKMLADGMGGEISASRSDDETVIIMVHGLRPDA